MTLKSTLIFLSSEMSYVTFFLWKILLKKPKNTKEPQQKAHRQTNYKPRGPQKIQYNKVQWKEEGTSTHPHVSLLACWGQHVTTSREATNFTVRKSPTEALTGMFHRTQQPVVRTAATDEREIKHHRHKRTSGKLHREQEPPDAKATITVDKTDLHL